MEQVKPLGLKDDIHEHEELADPLENNFVKKLRERIDNFSKDMSRLLNTIIAVCFGIYPIIVHANIPVGIECPCEISRINETKAE